ncbi:recombinase family protein [Candidatus Woesearchaeota archaeon]|nr:recombinase family protein [Candidatus Woesearchaeota archaeon]
MTYAVYVRVSTEEQNLDMQKLEISNYCQRMGWNYVIYEEKESTRKTRPVKQWLLQQLRLKKFGGVIVWRLDRWARSLQELVMDLEEMTNKNIKFISLRDNVDYTSASGRAFTQILCVFAEFERQLIRERTLAGLARAKAAGIKLGRPKGSKDGKVRRKSGYYMRYILENNKHKEFAL